MNDTNIKNPAETIKSGIGFNELIRELRYGSKYTRTTWPEDEYVFINKDGFLALYKNDKEYLWNIHEIDLDGTDYKIFTDFESPQETLQRHGENDEPSK